MKKLSLLLFASLLVSLNAFAGVCNNGSLRGIYSYQFDGMDTTSGAWAAAVGRVTFSGTGAATFSGVETSNGEAVTVSGAGTYFVSTLCNVSATILWSTGHTTSYRLHLNAIDTVPATNLAYHATAVVWTPSTGISAAGEIHRRDRKN